MLAMPLSDIPEREEVGHFALSMLVSMHFQAFNPLSLAKSPLSRNWKLRSWIINQEVGALPRVKGKTCNTFFDIN